MADPLRQYAKGGRTKRPRGSYHIVEAARALGYVTWAQLRSDLMRAGIKTVRGKDNKAYILAEDMRRFVKKTAPALLGQVLKPGTLE